MKISNIMAGGSLLFANTWISPLIYNITGYSSIYGMITISGIIYAIGGILVYRGCIK